MKKHIIISLLFLSVGLSQNQRNEYLVDNLIEMDNGLWTVKFSDEPISGKVYGYFGKESNPKKVYTGNLRNGKKEGNWKSYHYNTGRKSYEGTFKDGKEDGLIIKWYENGQKWIEGTSKDGKRDGLWTFWYVNGQKMYEYIYKDGILISEKEWNYDGSVKE